MAGRPLLFYHDFTSRNGFIHVFMTKISFTSIANLAHFSTLDNETIFVMYCFERVIPISMYWQSEFVITSMKLYCTLFALFQMKK